MAAIFVISFIILWRDGFNVVHARHPPDTLASIGAFHKLLGKRYVFDHHDLAPELYYARFGGRGNRIVYNALVALEKFACRVADHVIGTNESYKAVEMQRGDVPEQRITVVRNGPDLNELRTTAPDPDLRQKDKMIIGYVGVTGTQDGLDHLLRALHHLVLDLGRRDFLCVVVGSGDALPRLKPLAQQLSIGDYMLFTGWVDEPSEVVRHLRTMDIRVAPEPCDPYSDCSTATKVMEYVALGKPTVAFDLPEHRFTAQDAAVYARPNDELDFARKIVLLMDDPVRRKNMGQKGRERIEARLDWSHQQEHLIELCRTLLPERGYSAH
jgi:glycosyltransferase involved in cell wall biosynthesis